MRTNGCTYGSLLACGAHGPREETSKYQKPGAALARRFSYGATGPRGVWTRGATWRTVRKDATLAALDALASKRVAPASAAGYVVRKRLEEP